MPYSLQDFGSYCVAGQVVEVTEGTAREVSFTRAAKYIHDPRGHFSVGHAYVQYFVPARRNDAPPVVLVHGGGMHGGTWETTPDGRPGWLHLLIQRGYEVHVLDNVERGRSGFAPGHWDGDPLLRSQEEAWTLFRIGHPENFSTRTPFAGSQFPVQAFDHFARLFVPRWLTTTPLHVRALRAVLARTGPAMIICHSQGGEIAMDAITQAPELCTAFICLEPSTTVTKPDKLRHIPTVIFAGDFLDTAPHWTQRHADWVNWVETLNTIGGRITLVTGEAGHTHFPMFDRDNAQCLNMCLRAIDPMA